MLRPRLAIALLVLTSIPAAARAQDAPDRAGRLMALTAQSPGVWVASDRIWSPDQASYLSACGARGCAPVVDSESCVVPECPGAGFVYRVDRDSADVPGWPTDYDGYTSALGALRSDDSLVALRNRLVAHPESNERREREQRDEEARQREQERHAESVRWVSRHRRGDRLELSLTADLATLVEEGGSYAGGTATLSYVYLMHHRDAEEDGGSSWLPTVVFGDTLGAELRVHALHRLDDGQAARWMVAVGAAPVLSNRFDDTVVRAPSFWDLVAPELGVILRSDMDATWYASWDVPFSILVDHDFAVDVAAQLFVIDEWIELPDDAPEDAEDPAELILMLSVGGRLP